MPLLSTARFIGALVSLLVLACAAYLLWTWVQGAWVVDPYGHSIHVRQNWRLGVGAALAALSFLGRFPALALLARPDRRPVDSPTPTRDGQLEPGASGSSLYVERQGPAGAPLVILTHGWGMDTTFFEAAKRDLSDRYRLVLWDLPGLGRSKLPPNRRVDLRAFAADLAGLVEAHGGRAVLVGHSIGGMVIQTLVRDYPEAARRLAGIVLLNTTYTDPLQTMILSRLFTSMRGLLSASSRLAVALAPLVWLSSWQSYLSGTAQAAMRLGFGPNVTRRELDRATLLSTRNSPGVQAKGNLAMFRWDATGALEHFFGPVLVIAGDRDIVTKREAGERIAQEPPLGQFEVVDRANHMGPMDRAETYNRLIADFVLAAQASGTRDQRSPANRPDEEQTRWAERDAQERPAGPPH
jgi:pimeloyl-ACP methyl ester carboxylesterase